MKGILHKWLGNRLIALASYNSIYIAIRIVIGAVMSKVIAIYAGTLGMALTGNLRNLAQGLQTFSLLGVEQGIVKFTAQYQKDKHLLKKYLSTAWVMSLWSSIIIAVILLIAAPWIASYLLTDEYVNLIRLLAVAVPLYLVFAFIANILNGLESYRNYVNLQISVSLVVFVVSLCLVYKYEVTGALYSIVIAIMLQSFIALFFVKKLFPNSGIKDYFSFSLDRSIVKQYLSYSLMALASALLLPTAHILIRTHLLNELGDDAAGSWEGMLRVSGYYMMFSTALISLYVLPTLSKDDSYKNYRNTILEFLKTIIPFVIAGMIAVYFAKGLIIDILFTSEFYDMKSLFKWQLLGDFIKVITTVLAFQFIARNDVKRYLVSEVISVLSFVILSFMMIEINGLEGVVQAHLISYLIYFMVLLILLRKELFAKL